MDTSPSSNQETSTVASQVPSLASLLEHGIHCTRQGHYIEAVAFLERAREQLSPQQTQCAAALDACIQSHTNRSQAQQELFAASKRFVEAETAHQTHLLSLEKLAATLEEDTHTGNVVTPLVDVRPCLQTQSSNGVTSLVGVRPHALPKNGATLPALYATCFGHFEVRRSDKPIVLCSSRNGQAILRYLIAKPGHCSTSDTLQTMFWPEDEPEIAQRKLHIAISALRRSLHASSPEEPACDHIICKNRVYSLNPAVTIRTDADEFLHHYQAGQQASAEKITFFERACHLYTGPFLPEDMYADWSFLQREQLNQTYLAMCRVLADHYFKIKHYEAATKWAIAILKENHCDETAHRQLIQIYTAQGYRSEALQQYQRCEHLLRKELGMQPLPETQAILQTILTSASTSPHNKAKT